MVKTYRKGYRGELELVHLLAKHGWLVLRSPRSGRIRLPSPDIVAVKNGKVLALECKVREEAFSIPKEQVEQLAAWEKRGGAHAFIAWKIPRREWRFFKIMDVKRNNYKLNKRLFKKGILFTELLLSLE